MGRLQTRIIKRLKAGNEIVFMNTHYSPNTKAVVEKADAHFCLWGTSYSVFGDHLYSWAEDFLLLHGSWKEDLKVAIKTLEIVQF